MRTEISSRHWPWARAGLSALAFALWFSALWFATSMDRGGAEVARSAAQSLLVGLSLGLFVLVVERLTSGLGGHLFLDDDGITWYPPRGRGKTFCYESLWFVGIMGRFMEEWLVLRSRHQEIRLRREVFANPRAPEALVAEVLDRVEKRPGGAALRAWLERRRAVAARQSAVRLVAAPAIAAVLVAVFLLAAAVGAARDPARLLVLGANAPALVAEGEVYRLATTNLLHAGWLHLAYNLAGLLWLSWSLEPLLGRGRFLTLFLASALAGSAASAAFGTYELAAGASNGVYGLLGALLVLLARHGRQLPWPHRLEWWPPVFFLFLFPLVGDHLDVAAHFGALLAGSLFQLFMTPKDLDLSTLALRHRRSFNRAAAVLTALVLAALPFAPLAQELLRGALQR